MSPATMIDPEIRPTKVDRPSDVTGMVSTGNLTGVLSDKDDVVAVMESVVRLSNNKLGKVDTAITSDAVIKDLVRCGYLKDSLIVGPAEGYRSLQGQPDCRSGGHIFAGGLRQ